MSKSELQSIKRWIKKIKKLKCQYGTAEGNDPRDWSKLNLPYSVIGRGHQRIVFDMKNNYVLKVAITLNGIKHNKLEARLYRFASAAPKKHLAKVKEQGNGWIIMKKMNHEVMDTESNRLKLYRLQKNFIKSGIEPNDLLGKRKKIKWRNLRLNEKGHIMVIDYGDFRLIA